MGSKQWMCGELPLLAQVDQKKKSLTPQGAVAITPCPQTSLSSRPSPAPALAGASPYSSQSLCFCLGSFP